MDITVYHIINRIYTYIQDNGVRVYNIYSKNCQKKAIAVFRNLKSLDRVHPISTDMLISVAKVIKSKQSIRSLVWGRFYFDLQRSGAQAGA